MPNPLQESAMLVTLTISQWTARKHDKSVSAEVDRNHGAKDAGRYNKLLISKEALDSIAKIEGAARAYFYKVTHAWGDNGERMLPAALFMDFAQTMQKYQSDLDAYNAEQASSDGVFGSLLSLGGMALGGPLGGSLASMMTAGSNPYAAGGYVGNGLKVPRGVYG